jgi:L,D-transpeptidase catalytic domain
MGSLVGAALVVVPVAALREATASVAVGGAVAVPTVAAAAAQDAGGPRGARVQGSLPPGPISVSTQDDGLRAFSGPSIDTPSRVVPATNPWGERLSFPVVERTRDARGNRWLRVLLGVAPNGADGWVLAGRVWAIPVHDRIVVDLSARRLRRWHGGHLRQRFDVAIGASGTPTTPGHFFVWARLDAAADGPYGTYVLGLSGFPPTGSEAPDGARIAIHGTADPTDLGLRVSHGCVRVLNSDMLRLRDVPIGTPVVIRP